MLHHKTKTANIKKMMKALSSLQTFINCKVFLYNNYSNSQRPRVMSAVQPSMKFIHLMIAHIKPYKYHTVLLTVLADSFLSTEFHHCHHI